jgi:hypothetical protein
MAYTINRYNTATLTTVEDGTLDQTTDLKLVGKNYAGYGEIQNENFVFLLENFAGANQPPKAISGQVWFDSGNSKLKFYDGSQWRTTGGAEVSGSTPAGLSEGDFWWDTNNEQLYAYNGTDFVLVGPQDAGEGITQMQSRTVRDDQSLTKSVITATVNDEVIFVISSQQFTIDSSDAENAIPGFNVVRQGITLKNTISSTDGVTSSAHRFWGTASNAEKLAGRSASEYVVAEPGSPSVFTEAAYFQTDSGIAIGQGLDLKLFIENDNEGVIANDVGTLIKFRAKQTGVNQNIIDLAAGLVTPGVANSGTGVNSVDLGSTVKKFNDVHINGTYYGTAEKASKLIFSGTARDPKVDTAGSGSAYSVAIRDASGNLNATLFQGTATSARYADLAEKYTTPGDLTPGTVVTVCSHSDHEVEAAKIGDIAIGVVSTDPAVMMNSEAEGQYIGLKGRLPVRVIGAVKKGEAVYVDNNGCASTNINGGSIVGIALETNEDDSEKLVECVLKV